MEMLLRVLDTKGTGRRTIHRQVPAQLDLGADELVVLLTLRDRGMGRTPITEPDPQNIRVDREVCFRVLHGAMCHQRRFAGTVALGKGFCGLGLEYRPFAAQAHRPLVLGIDHHRGPVVSHDLIELTISPDRRHRNDFRRAPVAAEDLITCDQGLYGAETRGCGHQRTDGTCFPMPGRHQQHQARAFALFHLAAEALQAPADVLVDPAGEVSGVDFLGKRQQAAPCQHPMGQLTARGVKRGDFELTIF
jgi:hypothetical protein